MNAVRLLLVMFSMLPLAANSATEDALLSKKILGVWAESSSQMTSLERQAEKVGIIGAEQFLPNGEGKTILYRGVICGTVIRMHSFHWKIDNGILILSDESSDVTREKIVELTRKALVLLPLSSTEELHRIPHAACSAS